MSADMHKSISVPYDWLEKASPEALAHDDVPLFGASPPFPWERLADYLKNKLHVENFNVTRSNITQKEQEELLEGIGSPYRIHAVTVIPLDAHILFVMSEQEVNKLLTALLSSQEPSFDLDENFVSPFFTFTAMEAINAVGKVGFDSQLILNLDSTPQAVPNTFCHAFNLNIQLNDTQVAARILIPPKFRAAWKSHYHRKPLHVPIDSHLAQSIETTLHLEAGKLHMNLNEWKNVREGDFVSLDFCSLDPSGRKGKLQLTVHNTPLFRGKLKDGNIKILENPLYHEDFTPMPNNKFDDDEENVDFSELDEDLTHDEDEFTNEDESLEYDSEDESSLLEEDNDLEPRKRDLDSLDDEDEESIEEEPLRGTQELSAMHEEPHSAFHTQEAPSALTHTLSPKKPIRPEEIPLDIVVEVGRIRMSIQKIMELQPGNLLELNIKPEDGVDLVVNGEKIARGELLLLGDHLGVRITNIG